MRPTCWKCGSEQVTVRFIGYGATYHKKGECETTCVRGKPCGEPPQGVLTCRSCGNVWKDGDISEFGLEA